MAEFFYVFLRPRSITLDFTHIGHLLFNFSASEGFLLPIPFLKNKCISLCDIKISQSEVICFFTAQNKVKVFR